MPRTASQNAAIRDESRALVVEAATRIFARTGFAAAKMSDIAREAGLSHGLAYHYFPNKKAVFLAVVETEMQGTQLLVTEALDGEGSPLTRLRTLCQRMLDGARENPGHYLITAQSSMSGGAPPEARVMLQRLTRKVGAAFTKLITEAQRLGLTSKDDPEILARTLLATIAGLGAAVALGPNAGAPPSVDIVMRVIGAKANNKKG